MSLHRMGNYIMDIKYLSINKIKVYILKSLAQYVQWLIAFVVKNHISDSHLDIISKEYILKTEEQLPYLDRKIDNLVTLLVIKGPIFSD